LPNNCRKRDSNAMFTLFRANTKSYIRYGMNTYPIFLNLEQPPDKELDYRTIKLWNNLEPFLKLIQSVHIFKRLIRNQLLDNFVNAS